MTLSLALQTSTIPSPKNPITSPKLPEKKLEKRNTHTHCTLKPLLNFNRNLTHYRLISAQLENSVETPNPTSIITLILESDIET
jgi:hypothetical protein